MNKILIIDDEASLRSMLRLNLRQHEYEVSEAESINSALRIFKEQKFDLIILDLGFSDGHGFEFLKQVREWSQVPILILTVDENEEMKVRLLEAGADDYVTKPFSLPELLARIKVALRHAQGEHTFSIFESGKLKVDLTQRQVWLAGELVRLTVTEYTILRLLIRQGGRVVSQEHLLSEVWGPLGLENPHYIRIYIGHLRKKLEENPSLPEHILTEVGVGYRIR